MNLQNILAGVSPPTQRVYTYNDLADLGIPYSRSHLWRLWKVGKFPKPFKYSPNLNGWTGDELAAWVNAKIAARDQTA